ncbi:ATP-binding protein, partial [candidate division KSB1 bacterium]
YRIIPVTKDDPGIKWDDLIENLLNIKHETQLEFNKIKAEIAAGIIVHNVITQLKEEEDEKIQEGLDSDSVLKHIKKLTNRYNSLRLEKDNLIISDGYDEFDLKDLSTGVREQVMLALRIGFCAKVTGNDPLFFILDDAFQHCDWEKREILVRQLAEIAKDGWQIIYLTMDDHIKKLFEETVGDNTDLESRIIEL